MNVDERAFFIVCRGARLPAILSLPRQPALQVGVLIVVGGPQYRVGSHRQFVLLARHLAASGIAALRFDMRGMGDAEGEFPGFAGCGDDLQAALDAFMAHCPQLQGVVLWGLCDGASAACLYAARDARVRGLVLLNPWVRTGQGEARTYLRHYYLQRLLSVQFWRKLAAGGVALGRSLRELGRSARQAVEAGAGDEADLPARMAAALQRAGCRSLILLSERDYVAREFEQVAGSHALWRALAPQIELQSLPGADHTCSSAAARERVARQTVAWIRARFAA